MAGQKNGDVQIQKLLPEFNQPDELEMFIFLSSVRILSEFENNIAKTEFQFNCDWNVEKGIIVLLHPNWINVL